MRTVLAAKQQCVWFKYLRQWSPFIFSILWRSWRSSFGNKRTELENEVQRRKTIALSIRISINPLKIYRRVQRRFKFHEG